MRMGELPTRQDESGQMRFTVFIPISLGSQGLG